MSTIVKRMFSLPSLLISVMMFVTTPASAQSKHISLDERVKILKDKLNLTGEQAKKIKTILEDQREETTLAINDSRGTGKTRDSVLQEMAIKTDGKIKEILTEEQRAAYDDIKQERQAPLSRRTKGRSK
jgi:Spy/CpxP family protein refolding chaperone